MTTTQVTDLPNYDDITKDTATDVIVRCKPEGLTINGSIEGRAEAVRVLILGRHCKVPSERVYIPDYPIVEIERLIGRDGLGVETWVKFNVGAFAMLVIRGLVPFARAGGAFLPVGPSVNQ